MEIFWLYVAILFWGRRLLINKQLLFDFITLSRAFSVGEERGRGELRIHNEYLCLQNVENVAQNVAKRHGEASGASCNSCRQTHQLPKIAIPGVIGVVDGQKGGGGKRAEGGAPTVSQPASQPACCVAFNFINTFIILCHTEAVAQVAPATRLLPSLSPPSLLPRLCRRQSVCHSGRFG